MSLGMDLVLYRLVARSQSCFRITPSSCRQPRAAGRSRYGSFELYCIFGPFLTCCSALNHLTRAVHHAPHALPSDHACSGADCCLPPPPPPPPPLPMVCSIHVVRCSRRFGWSDRSWWYSDLDSIPCMTHPYTMASAVLVMCALIGALLWSIGARFWRVRWSIGSRLKREKGSCYGQFRTSGLAFAYLCSSICALNTARCGRLAHALGPLRTSGRACVSDHLAQGVRPRFGSQPRGAVRSP